MQEPKGPLRDACSTLLHTLRNAAGFPSTSMVSGERFEKAAVALEEGFLALIKPHQTHEMAPETAQKALEQVRALRSDIQKLLERVDEYKELVSNQPTFRLVLLNNDVLIEGQDYVDENGDIRLLDVNVNEGDIIQAFEVLGHRDFIQREYEHDERDVS